MPSIRYHVMPRDAPPDLRDLRALLTRQRLRLFLCERDKGDAAVAEQRAKVMHTVMRLLSREQELGIPPSEEVTFVYFVQAGEFVKIGQSKRWKQRVDQMQVGSPHPIIPLLVLLGDLVSRASCIGVLGLTTFEVSGFECRSLSPLSLLPMRSNAC